MSLESFLKIFLLSTVLFLLSTAFKLQIIQGKENWQRASQNRFRIISIPATRGIFFDKNGEPLIESSNNQRNYLYPKQFAHVLGYIGLADEKDLAYFGTDLNQNVGKTGLEKSQNQILAGNNGGMVEEYSATGEKLRSFSQVKPISGRSIQLSIDKNLQNKAYELLEIGKYKGAVIASTPDGQILAMVSYPSFDSNAFVQNDEIKIGQILNDENNSMFNRAISGLYPPASTFKIVTALAALENQIIDADYQIEDTGILKIGDFSYANWYYTDYSKTDGVVNLVKALQRSNDIFFYKVGEELGIEQLANWAHKLGLGQKTGIEIEGEAQGLIPSDKWKKETLDEDWYTGDTFITAIGQGNLQATPLQILRLTNIVASNGYICQPSLISAIVDEGVKNFNFKINYRRENCQKLDIQEKNLALVKQGMKAACQDGGTAWPLFEFKVKSDKLKVDGINYFKSASDSAQMIRIPVACKTGTAETGRTEIINSKLKHLTHAWLTAYAPVENPEIVVTVLLEDSGQGSDIAGPVVRDMFKTYFENKN